MSQSTFCRWGNEHDDPGSHRRCPGIKCDCHCHGEGAVGDLRNLPDDNIVTPRDTPEGDTVTTIAEHRIAANAPDARKPKRTRRTWSDDDKRRIAIEYSEAPSGTRKTVLAKYELVPSVVGKWCRDLGLNLRGSRRSHEAPPDRAKTTDPDVATDTEVLEPELTHEQRVGIILEGDEIDVFGAIAFLEGIGPDELAARLVTELIENSRADPDVNLCVTAKRARAAEAA